MIIIIFVYGHIHISCYTHYGRFIRKT